MWHVHEMAHRARINWPCECSLNAHLKKVNWNLAISNYSQECKCLSNENFTNSYTWRDLLQDTFLRLMMPILSRINRKLQLLMFFSLLHTIVLIFFSIRKSRSLFYLEQPSPQELTPQTLIPTISPRIY